MVTRPRSTKRQLYHTEQRAQVSGVLTTATVHSSSLSKASCVGSLVRMQHGLQVYYYDQRMRDPTTEDLYEAYRYKHVPRSGLPLPKKAPKREARQYPFHKTRDGTGSVLGDLLKRGIYQLQDLIGDCRRDILHQLPANDKNKTLLKNLSVKHNVLRERLGKKIDEMERDTGIVYTAPVYFKDFPALED